MAKSGAWLQSRNRVVMMLCLLSGIAAQAQGQSAPRPEQLIKWRQSAYQVIAWNSARLKAALASNHDAREVQAAAASLAAVAASGLPALFPAGTEKGKGWRETTARDSVFRDAGKFRELSEEFARESGLLSRLAAGPDSKAVQAQFLKVAAACKSCHEKFRQTD